MILSEKYEMMRKNFRNFAETEFTTEIQERLDREGGFDEELFAKIAKYGFCGIKIPVEYGGQGGDSLAYVLMNEEFARVMPVGAIYANTPNSLGSGPLLACGNEEQKQRILPDVASGKKHIVFALTEPGAGSDAGGTLTTADADGDDFILNGRKCFITMAPIAKYHIVYAKTDPEKGTKGISAFIVDRDLKGVSVGKHEEKMGQHGVPVSDLILEDVRVPADCLLGEENMGFINAMKTLNVGRIGVASMALGIAQEALDLAVNHTKNRIQFGRPLCKNQALSFMMADMETKLNAARNLVYNAAWLMDTKQDASKAASMAKYYTTEAAIEIVNKSLQLHGGYGYSREYEIERLYRDVRITSIYEGSSQVQQMVIAGSLLK